MSFVSGRFQHCFLLVILLISLCQFNYALYYSNKLSGKFPRQGKRADQDISSNPEREMNYFRRGNANIWALKRFYALFGKRGLVNLDKAMRLSSF